MTLYDICDSRTVVQVLPWPEPSQTLYGIQMDTEDHFILFLSSVKTNCMALSGWLFLAILTLVRVWSKFSPATQIKTEKDSVTIA